MSENEAYLGAYFSSLFNGLCRTKSKLFKSNVIQDVRLQCECVSAF